MIRLLAFVSRTGIVLTVAVYPSCFSPVSRFLSWRNILSPYSDRGSATSLNNAKGHPAAGPIR
jgi:hypothetical protein